MSSTPVEPDDGIKWPSTASQVREQILDAAIKVYGEHRYDAGSLSEVAERAHLSEEELQRHYPTKEALLLGILERRHARNMGLGNLGAATGVQRLINLISGISRDTDFPTEMRLFAILSADAGRADHPAHEHLHRRYEWAVGGVELAFRQAAEDGYLLPGVDPASAATQLIALWDGLQIQWLLGVGNIDMVAELTRFIGLHLSRPIEELLKA